MTTCTKLLDAWQQVAPNECCSNSIQVCFIGIDVTTMYCGNYVLSPMHVLVAKARIFSGQLGSVVSKSHGKATTEKQTKKQNKHWTVEERRRFQEEWINFYFVGPQGAEMMPHLQTGEFNAEGI